MVEPCSIIWLYITKQLEYVKDRITMYTILFTFIKVISGITILDNMISLITLSCLSVAQASCSFKRLDISTQPHMSHLPL